MTDIDVSGWSDAELAEFYERAMASALKWEQCGGWLSAMGLPHYSAMLDVMTLTGGELQRRAAAIDQEAILWGDA